MLTQARKRQYHGCDLLSLDMLEMRGKASIHGSSQSFLLSLHLLRQLVVLARA